MTPPPLFDQIQEAAAAIRAKWATPPKVGIILGTGLSALAEDIAADAMIRYEDIPYFPKSTVQSHTGQLVCGTLAGRTVVAMEGRFHFYEGYKLQQVTFPVRVMKALGCDTLIVSNACGGMNPQYAKGDIMVIEDHINLIGDNPLIGPNDERLGDRFPDMSRVYDRDLMKLARTVAVEEHIAVQQGVYVAVAGPNLETRAEYRFLRTIGADVVGMSTVPEAIVAVHSKMKVLGFSAVTDMCLPDALEPVSLADILKTAADCEKKLRVLVRKVVERMP
jgi:purine-nucleoside phosphorylase